MNELRKAIEPPDDSSSDSDEAALLAQLRSAGRVESTGTFTVDPSGRLELALKEAESPEGALSQAGFAAIHASLTPLLGSLKEVDMARKPIAWDEFSDATQEQAEAARRRELLTLVERWSRALGTLLPKLARDFEQRVSETHDTDALRQHLGRGVWLAVQAERLGVRDHAATNDLKETPSSVWKLPAWLRLTRRRRTSDTETLQGNQKQLDEHDYFKQVIGVAQSWSGPGLQPLLPWLIGGDVADHAFRQRIAESLILFGNPNVARITWVSKDQAHRPLLGTVELSRAASRRWGDERMFVGKSIIETIDGKEYRPVRIRRAPNGDPYGDVSIGARGGIWGSATVPFRDQALLEAINGRQIDSVYRLSYRWHDDDEDAGIDFLAPLPNTGLAGVVQFVVKTNYSPIHSKPVLFYQEKLWSEIQGKAIDEVHQWAWDDHGRVWARVHHKHDGGRRWSDSFIQMSEHGLTTYRDKESFLSAYRHANPEKSTGDLE